MSLSKFTLYSERIAFFLEKCNTGRLNSNLVVELKKYDTTLLSVLLQVRMGNKRRE